MKHLTPGWEQENQFSPMECHCVDQSHSRAGSLPMSTWPTQNKVNMHIHTCSVCLFVCFCLIGFFCLFVIIFAFCFYFKKERNDMSLGRHRGWGDLERVEGEERI